MKKKDKNQDQDIREEYDFSEGVRGKYSEQFPVGSNVVVLDPDVASEFPTRESVNEALRESARRRHQSPGENA